MVLIVNTSERTGGAAVAANRLTKALNKNGIDAEMLVADKNTSDVHVFDIPGKLRKKYNFIFERLLILVRNKFSKKRLFEIDPAFTGTDITKLPCFKKADVIHLHWINQGMLSMRNLRKIIRSGKKIVWTMHDQWCSTGICHSTGDCLKFQTHCAACPVLQTSRRKDLAWRTFVKKKRLFAARSITFVTCSRWLKRIASTGALFENQHVIDIPNPIDTDLFRPMDRTACRQALNLPLGNRLILVGAVNVTDYRKGIDYMVNALNRLFEEPEFPQNTEVVCMGNGASALQALLHGKVHPLDYIKDEALLCQVYSAVDMFFTPSLFENLPNMIMEAMACGTPCLGFNVGGIPEMIDHLQNGYVAEYKSTEDLVNGLQYLMKLPNDVYREYSANCRQKVLDCYSENIVAQRYGKVYCKV
ncbi:MAG: glycosyltransferase [Bacteroides sp.]|nr:glycosyltransferase [Bacteroides sp.]